MLNNLFISIFIREIQNKLILKTLLVTIIVLFLLNNTIKEIFASNFVEKEIFKTAISQFHSKNYEDALKNFERALKVNPSSGAAKYYIAEIYFIKGNLNESLKYYEQIVDDKEYGPLAINRIEKIQNSIKIEKLIKSIALNLDYLQYNEAFAAIKEAQKLSPNDTRIYYYAFLANVLTNQLDKAKRIIDHLRKSFPSNSKTGNQNKIENNINQHESILYSMQSLVYAWETANYNPEQALQYFKNVTDKILWISPVKKVYVQFLKKNNLLDDYEDFLLSEMQSSSTEKKSIEDELIRFYLDHGYYNKAMNILKNRHIESLQDNLLLVECLIKLKDINKAFNLATPLYKAYNDDPQVVKIWLASLIAYSNEYKELPILDENLSIRENNNKTQESNEEIIKQVSRIIKKFSSDLEILVNSLELSINIKSESLINLAIEKILKNPIYNNLIENLVYICQKLTENNYRNYSTYLLEALLANFPEDPRIQRMLAENYYLDERTTEAYELLMSAYNSDPSSYKTLNMLIDVMTTLGKLNEAMELITQKINDPYIDEIIKRQLKIKANKLSNIIHTSDVNNSANGGNTQK